MEQNLTFERMKHIVSDAYIGRMFVFILAAVLVLIIIMWIISVSKRKEANCTAMNKLYEDFPTLHSINPNSNDFKHKLRDYYIKTAYNACSAGTYKNDFVSTCALKDCIRQGARCLDFEIYSVDNKPVIATSSVNDYTIKQTYNSVPFGDILTIINDYAFSGSTCPNPNDPLIIHLRIMSNNKQIYTEMADAISNVIESRVLGPNYSYENHGKNLGITPITELMGKIIIIADKSNPLYETTPLDEYINIATNSIFMWALRYTQGIKYASSIDELTTFNKKNMTLCLPDLNPSPENPSPSLAMSYGCQMVAMCFQNFDANMEYYTKFFDKNGTAFVLKPAALRFVPLTIPAPTPQNPEYSYKERAVSTDYYSFHI